MLDFYAALSGMEAAERRKKIPEMLDLVGLDQWGSVRIGKYSKGMLQRLGLAQALIHSPSMLILDEPTDGVDPVGRRQIRDVLTRFEEQGVTIFINSHLLVEVETFCREVAILDKGKVALTGKMHDLTAGKGYRLTVLRRRLRFSWRHCARRRRRPLPETDSSISSSQRVNWRTRRWICCGRSAVKLRRWSRPPVHSRRSLSGRSGNEKFADGFNRLDPRYVP